MRTSFLEMGPLFFSCTDEVDADKVPTLRHPKKAEEWLSDSMVLAMSSQRIYDRLCQQWFSKYRGLASENTDEVPSEGDAERCTLDAAGRCVCKHKGHKNFRDFNQESTNIIIKAKGGTEESHGLRSRCANIADETIAPHRRPDSLQSTTEQKVDGKRFRGVAFEILESLPPAEQKVPAWKRVFVGAADGARLIAQAVERRKTSKRRRMQHGRGVGDDKLRRSKTQIEAGHALRDALPPQPGAAAYYVQGGATPDAAQAYNADLLRHRKAEDGTINETGHAKSWLVGTQEVVEEVLSSGSGPATLSAAQKEIVGNHAGFANALSATKRRLENQGSGRRVSRTKAEEAKAARTPQWHGTPWGCDQ